MGYILMYCKHIVFQRREIWKILITNQLVPRYFADIELHLVVKNDIFVVSSGCLDSDVEMDFSRIAL
jgi:hypothetical protein